MSKKINYFVIVTVRNGYEYIHESLYSLSKQSILPSLIVVVNDGSSDKTDELLSKISNEIPFVKTIVLPDRGYDIRRVVHNWNLALDYVRTTGIKFDYYLTGSDDSIFPHDYVEKILNYMEADQSLVIASGNRGIIRHDETSFPEGAGRIIRNSFFESIGFRYPQFYGYESWILYKALQMGFKVKKFDHVLYKHSRKSGSVTNFSDFVAGMKCLGYNPLFVIARLIVNSSSKNKLFSKKQAIKMFFEFFFKHDYHDDPYFCYFPSDFRKFVSSMQKNRLIQKLLHQKNKSD